MRISSRKQDKRVKCECEINKNILFFETTAALLPENMHIIDCDLFYKTACRVENSSVQGYVTGNLSQPQAPWPFSAGASAADNKPVSSTFACYFKLKYIKIFPLETNQTWQINRIYRFEGIS